MFKKVAIVAAVSLPALVGVVSTSATSAAASTADPCGNGPGVTTYHNCFDQNRWLHVIYENGDATASCVPAGTDFPLPEGTKQAWFEGIC